MICDGRAASGLPFSILGSNSLFAFTQADLAPGRTVASAIKSGNVADRLGNHLNPYNPYFDTSAFVVPAAGATDFGTLGRNIIRDRNRSTPTSPS